MGTSSPGSPVIVQQPPPPHEERHVIRHAPLLVFTLIAVVIVILYAWLAKWPGFPMSIDIGQVMNKLAPLILAAAFIERAVEVIISPWRDTEATILENRLNYLKAQTPPDPAKIAAADAAFQEYTGQTKQYASGVGLTLGVLAAYVGVRAFWPFVDLAALKTAVDLAAQKAGSGIGPHQVSMFNVVDVVISAALLAGGADGIHQVVNSFTTFFNTTAQKQQQSATMPTPPPTPETTTTTTPTTTTTTTTPTPSA